MSEEQTQQLMQQMQMLENYFVDISQRESTLLSVLREAVAAIESIKSLSLKSNSDSLVPIGMGAYVQTKISSNDKIVLNIGAGVAIEKNSISAMNYLEARIKEIEVALQDNTAKKQDILYRLEQGKQRLNQILEDSSQNISG